MSTKKPALAVDGKAWIHVADRDLMALLAAGSEGAPRAGGEDADPMGVRIVRLDLGLGVGAVVGQPKAAPEPPPPPRV